MIDFKTYLQKFSDLLPMGTSVSYTEAEKRASRFLEAQATITDWRHTLGAQKIQASSVQTAIYAVELSRGLAKTMTENKVTAEASEAYLKAREELESIENDLSYLRAYYDIFQNAHVFYRQLAKGENA